MCSARRARGSATNGTDRVTVRCASAATRSRSVGVTLVIFSHLARGQLVGIGSSVEVKKKRRSVAVSYTHLTLPTKA